MIKPYTLSIVQKLWITVTLAILITVLFGFGLSKVFYENLYVDKVERDLILEGKKLSEDYTGGVISGQFIDNIKWYNQKNEAEIFTITDHNQMDSLINTDERTLLLKGKTITQTVFKKQFSGNIKAVIVPLLNNSELAGVIYLYVPLATIQDLSEDFTVFWILATLLFIVFSVYFGTLWISKLTSPLKVMEKAATSISKGDYSVRIAYDENNEIGSLASAFNEMAENIQSEDERKKEFLANVSHELRTPLSYIKGYSEAILDTLVKTKEERLKYLHLIVKESNRMQQLVTDLLDLAKLDRGPVHISNKYPLAFSQFIEDFLEFYYPVAKERNILLKAELDPEPIINGDEKGLGQVLQNLLDNAFQYTPAGGTIIVRLFGDANTCVMEVEDNGTGIPDVEIPKVTERFYRVDKARSRAKGGSGLGLAIVKKVIDIHDGKLIISSKLMKGTTVRIILPIYTE